MKTLPHITRTLMFAGLALACARPAIAGPLALAKTFEGNINFVGTQASMQSKSGGAKACDLVSSAKAGIALPSNANLLSATLYWAGTGPVDTEVLLDGARVGAATDRRYTSTIDGLTYFAAAADVTALVKDRTTFTFGGLDVSKADIYCANQQKGNAMVAGFSLVVIYSREGEPYRTLNVYEGMQAIKNASVTVQMGDYTPPAVSTGGGRIGYIVWEGDKTGQQKDDSVTFAGAYLSNPPYVQKGDAFNAKSSANGDTASNGIDFDIVDVSPPASAANASAVFITASDRVLLSTAIAALPSKPADLSIKKTVSGEFKTGNEITYTLKVANEGARADSKVEVRDTLPDALAYVSASGTDWTCSVAGQAVSCKYGKPLAPGANTSIELTAKITGSGRISNTAEVSGSADGVPGNNRSTAEGDAGGPQVGKDPFVFTVGPCLKDVVIQSTGEGCALFTGPVVAGSSPTIYITHAENGIAKPISTTSKTSLSVRYSLECNNPAATANTSASYAGVSLGTCVAHNTPVSDTIGQAATLDFDANEVSRKASFTYADAGRVTLRMRDSAGNIARTNFVSLPRTLGALYRRVDGGVPNPGSTTLAQPGFAEAGEPFEIVVSAYGMDGSTPLNNFGNESGEYALSKTLAVQANGKQGLLQALGDWKGAGSVARPLAWNEVGTVDLSASLGAYLGVGDPLSTKPETVGRFYPQYFETETGGGFACLKRMGCPAEAPHFISRAVFSRQAFGAVVRAYGRNGLLNGYDDADKKHLVPRISLLALSAPGETGKPIGKFVNGEAAPATARDVSFQLDVGFDAKAGTRGWTPPTAVHVRATAPELRKTAAGAQAVELSSLREQGIASEEGGMMVVNGRLMVGNAIGTPLSKTPVPLYAQFWSGLAWEQNSGVEETEPVMGSVEFSSCRRSLRLSTAMGDTCDLNVLRIQGTASGSEKGIALPMLKGGKAKLVLAPVGDRSGNVDLFVNGEDYLPSTFGRVTFGQFKSPVIYVREMY